MTKLFSRNQFKTKVQNRDFRCQRLNAVSREYEEVEVEVPSPIYETIKLYNHQEMRQGGAEHDLHCFEFFN